MAQELINIGTVDAKQGDNLFTGGNKINNNFTELYSIVGADNMVYLRSEEDLPNQTATTWEMDPDIPYKIAGNFSTVLQCKPAGGASLSGDNLSAYVMSFTGSGAMFKGTDVDFYINNISIDPGISNTAFEFDDTVGGVRLFIAQNVQVNNCAIWGKFTNMRLAQVLNCDGRNAGNGLQFFGTSGITWSVSRLSLTSTNTAFKGVDLGTATAIIPEFSNIFMTAPSGAFGISGLVNNGNVPTGRLGQVLGCEFIGGMTDLENISTKDIRWDFRNNSPTQDTQPDALASFHSNATETVITSSSSDGSNAVVIAGTWVEVQVSHFTSTVGGRFTYVGERILKGPVDVSVGLISSGGGSITVEVYIAVNGAPIIDSGIDVSISGSTAANLSIPWQLTFNQNDYIEIVVENQTNITNVIADHAVLRIL